jgi:hypothetical protein
MIKFSELSLHLKIPIIISWILGALGFVSLVLGFIEGFYGA